MKITVDRGMGASFTAKVDMLFKAKVLRDHSRTYTTWKFRISDIDRTTMTIEGTSQELREFTQMMNECVSIMDKREALL